MTDEQTPGPAPETPGYQDAAAAKQRRSGYQDPGLKAMRDRVRQQWADAHDQQAQTEERRAATARGEIPAGEDPGIAAARERIAGQRDEGGGGRVRFRTPAHSMPAAQAARAAAEPAAPATPTPPRAPAPGRPR